MSWSKGRNNFTIRKNDKTTGTAAFFGILIEQCCVSRQHQHVSLATRNFLAEMSSQSFHVTGHLRRELTRGDFKWFKMNFSPLKNKSFTHHPGQTVKLPRVPTLGVKSLFHSLLPLHSIFLLSMIENILLALCITVTSNELDGSWKHPHTFSNLSLQNRALFVWVTSRVYNTLMTWSLKRKIGLSKSTYSHTSLI